MLEIRIPGIDTSTLTDDPMRTVRIIEKTVGMFGIVRSVRLAVCAMLDRDTPKGAVNVRREVKGVDIVLLAPNGTDISRVQDKLTGIQAALCSLFNPQDWVDRNADHGLPTMRCITTEGSQAVSNNTENLVWLALKLQLNLITTKKKQIERQIGKPLPANEHRESVDHTARVDELMLQIRYLKENTCSRELWQNRANMAVEKDAICIQSELVQMNAVVVRIEKLVREDVDALDKKAPPLAPPRRDGGTWPWARAPSNVSVHISEHRHEKAFLDSTSNTTDDDEIRQELQGLRAAVARSEQYLQELRSRRQVPVQEISTSPKSEPKLVQQIENTAEQQRALDLVERLEHVIESQQSEELAAAREETARAQDQLRQMQQGAEAQGAEISQDNRIVNTNYYSSDLGNASGWVNGGPPRTRPAIDSNIKNRNMDPPLTEPEVEGDSKWWPFKMNIHGSRGGEQEMARLRSAYRTSSAQLAKQGAAAALAAVAAGDTEARQRAEEEMAVKQEELQATHEAALQAAQAEAARGVDALQAAEAELQAAAAAREAALHEAAKQVEAAQRDAAQEVARLHSAYEVQLAEAKQEATVAKQKELEASHEAALLAAQTEADMRIQVLEKHEAEAAKQQAATKAAAKMAMQAKHALQMKRLKEDTGLAQKGTKHAALFAESSRRASQQAKHARALELQKEEQTAATEDAARVQSELEDAQGAAASAEAEL